jgi:hypothetical protein
MAIGRGSVKGSINRNIDTSVEPEGTFSATIGDDLYTLSLAQLNKLVPGHEFIVVYSVTNGRRRVSRLVDSSSLKKVEGNIKARNDRKIELVSGESYAFVEGVDIPPTATAGAKVSIHYAVQLGKNIGWEITVP